MATDKMDERAARGISVSLPAMVADDLENLAAVRFGTKSKAVTAAVQIAAVVFGDVATHGVSDPVDALDAYCRSRAGSS